MKVVEGVVAGGMPFLAFGAGPPLLVLPGLTATHANPEGLDRWFQVRGLRQAAERRCVHLVQRRPGLDAGTSIADLASDYAQAIESLFDGPVPVRGESTGGSIALQLAIDHPHLVQRLVVVAAASRLSEPGRLIQATFGDMISRGEIRRGWATFASSLATRTVARRLIWGLAWLAGPMFSSADHTDMVATLRAEDTFDVTERLSQILAPTLVIGGEKDPLYSRALFESTAAGIPCGRLVLVPGAGHVRSVAARSSRRAAQDFLTPGALPCEPGTTRALPPPELETRRSDECGSFSMLGASLAQGP